MKLPKIDSTVGEMDFRGIRWQIEAWHAGLSVLVVFGLTTTLFFLELSYRRQTRDVNLQFRLSELIAPTVLAAVAPVLSPSADDFSVRWEDGKLIDAINKPTKIEPPSSGPGIHYRSTPKTRECWWTSPDGRQIILVGTSASILRRHMTFFALKLGGVAALVFSLGFIGGHFCCQRALMPIRSIAKTAKTIMEGDLSRRIEVGNAKSELVQVAQLLNDTFAKLETSLNQQIRFTADASHELRTPLAVIISRIQLALSKERTIEQYRNALETCLSHAESMRRLVNGLLDLARMDASRVDLYLTPNDLQELAVECLQTIRPLADQREVRLYLDGPPTPCLMDLEKIRRVLLNLLSNAILYNVPGGRIHVVTRIAEEYVEIDVEDTGQGIAEEHLPRIFDRFYRADKSRNRTEGSSGLGLAICKGLVKAHGGSISVTSKVKQGSTFTVRLPRVREAQ